MIESHADDCPLVSVVIPAYNAERYIADTLQSILDQTYRNIEIIVIDDGSTDNTASILKGYADKIKIALRKNSGNCSIPRNDGIELANGKYISFFDADDLMLPDRIERQVKLLELTGCGMAASDYCNFDQATEYVNHFASCPRLSSEITRHADYFIPDSDLIRSILIEENFLITGSTLIKLENVKKINGFNSLLTSCEDFHLFYKLILIDSIVIDLKLSFKRRLHGNNVSANQFRMLENFVRSRSDLMKYEKSPILLSSLYATVKKHYIELIKQSLKKLLLQIAVKNIFLFLLFTIRCNPERI